MPPPQDLCQQHPPQEHLKCAGQWQGEEWRKDHEGQRRRRRTTTTTSKEIVPGWAIHLQEIDAAGDDDEHQVYYWKQQQQQEQE